MPKTIKNFFVSLASFALFDVSDAFDEVGGLVFGDEADVFFLLIILV
jgi:hypothetical protein